MNKPKLLLAVEKELFSGLFSEKDWAFVRERCDVLNAEPPSSPDAGFLREGLAEAEVVITSWRTARLDETVLSRANRLRLLCHAAGSVKPVVSEALWQRGVTVTSAASAIAYGVAEYCLGMTLMGTKRAFWLAENTRRGEWRENVGTCFGGASEIFREKVGIIGAGHVGRLFVGLLRHFECDILVYDPYMTSRYAEELGVRKVDTLDEIFRECLVVSLNAPSTEETERMLRGRHFAMLRRGALFINTARGKIIDEPELIEELRKENFVACLDVAETEPCPADHPFRTLPNVVLTPHVAGAVLQNRLRIGALVAEEVERYCEGRDPCFPVTEKQLATIG